MFRQLNSFSLHLLRVYSPPVLSARQSRYGTGNIISVIRNSISSKECVETYMRNNNHNNIPSADTVFRRIKDIASESGSNRRIGSQDHKILYIRELNISACS